jgi:hypothetical protein
VPSAYTASWSGRLNHFSLHNRRQDVTKARDGAFREILLVRFMHSGTGGHPTPHLLGAWECSLTV